MAHNLELHCLAIQLDRPDFLLVMRQHSVPIRAASPAAHQGLRTKSTPMVEM